MTEEYELNRRAIARALAERFIARGNARVTGSPYKSFDDMPYSYTEDFLLDADAVLEVFCPPQRARETINDLFNDALTEHGAQGYGRDTPGEKLFTGVVSQLQREVLAALAPPAVDEASSSNATSMQSNIDDLAKTLYWADIKDGDKENRILDEWRDKWWEEWSTMPISGPPFLKRWRAVATAAIRMFKRDANA